MKELYIRCVTAIVTSIKFPTKIRDAFIWPLASRILGVAYDMPQKLRAGFKFNAYMGDHLGRLALFYGRKEKYFWEPVTTQLIELLVTSAQSAIIAGSHAGLTVLYTRKAMKSPAARVHAFEPIPNLFEISQANFRLNPELTNISLSKKALGDKSGTVTMTRDRIRSRIIQDVETSSIETEVVPITTIDEYCSEHDIKTIDFILLDVEGYEYNALRGARELLKQNPPKDIIYEVIRSKDDTLGVAGRIEELLSSYGYSFYIINDTEDPLDATKSSTSLSLIKATEEAYNNHLQHRYFNMYATLRSEQQLLLLPRVKLS